MNIPREPTHYAVDIFTRKRNASIEEVVKLTLSSDHEEIKATLNMSNEHIRDERQVYRFDVGEKDIGEISSCTIEKTDSEYDWEPTKIEVTYKDERKIFSELKIEGEIPDQAYVFSSPDVTVTPDKPLIVHSTAPGHMERIEKALNTCCPSCSPITKRFFALSGQGQVAACLVFWLIIIIIILIIILIASLTPGQGQPGPPSVLQVFPEPTDGMIIARRKSQRNEMSIKSLSNLVDSYAEKVNDFSAQIVDCQSGSGPPANKTCRFDVVNLGAECVKSRGFGYNSDGPCIVLQIKPPRDWTPALFKDRADVPQNVKDWSPDFVPVTCEASLHPYIDYIGLVEINPPSGISKVYFPYREQEAYMAPLVAVHFGHLEYEVIIGVVCRLWDPKIDSSNVEQFTTKFDILLESNVNVNSSYLKRWYGNEEVNG